MEGIDLRTAFLFALTGVIAYITYHAPALGTAVVVALGTGLFVDRFLRRPSKTERDGAAEND